MFKLSGKLSVCAQLAYIYLEYTGDRIGPSWDTKMCLCARTI